MDQKAAEALVEVLLNAVREQFVRPMEAALCVLTLALCYKKDREWVRGYFERLAETSSKDVAGRGIFDALAGLASLPDPPPPDEIKRALNTSLRLIHGGRKHESR